MEIKANSAFKLNLAWSWGWAWQKGEYELLFKLWLLQGEILEVETLTGCIWNVWSMHQ
jgi:hypothetical protein